MSETNQEVTVADANQIDEIHRLMQQILFLEKTCHEQEGALNYLRAEVARLQELPQKDAAKRREREQALLTEIGMLRKGVSGGCSCPPGKCFNTAGTGLCWAKWAGLTAIRDVAQRAIDEALRGAVHPSRMADTAQQMPALSAPVAAPVMPPHVCKYMYRVEEGVRRCLTCKAVHPEDEKFT